VGKSLSRRLEILNYLRMANGRRSTTDIQGALTEPTPLRAIQRDLQAIKAMDVTLESDDSKPKGWLIRDKTLGGGMSPHTAISLFLIREQAARTLPKQTVEYLTPLFRQAESSIKSRNSKYMSWHKKIQVGSTSIFLNDRSIDAKIQEVIFDALLDNQQVEVRYQALTGKKYEKTHTLNPLQLITTADNLYLVCTIGIRQTLTTLLMTRIRSARLLASPVQRPLNFDPSQLKNYLFHVQRDNEPLSLRLKVKKQVSQYIEERRLSKSQTIKEFDSTWDIVVARVNDSRQLRTWLNGLGPDVEVLAPKSLRNAMRTGIKQALSYYSK
jgi:predicted DNA-binding transcriptional regulator YafY